MGRLTDTVNRRLPQLRYAPAERAGVRRAARPRDGTPRSRASWAASCKQSHGGEAPVRLQNAPQLTFLNFERSECHVLTKRRINAATIAGASCARNMISTGMRPLRASAMPARLSLQSCHVHVMYNPLETQIETRVKDVYELSCTRTTHVSELIIEIMLVIPAHCKVTSPAPSENKIHQALHVTGVA